MFVSDVDVFYEILEKSDYVLNMLLRMYISVNKSAFQMQWIMISSRILLTETVILLLWACFEVDLYVQLTFLKLKSLPGTQKCISQNIE